MARALDMMGDGPDDRGHFTATPTGASRPLAPVGYMLKLLGAVIPRIVRGIEQRADHPDVARSLNNLAVLRFATGDTASAVTLLREASELLESARDRDPFLPGVTHTLGVVCTNRGWISRGNGEASEMERLFVWALRLLEQTDSANPSLAIALIGLAVNYRDRGVYDSAELHMRRALAIRERFFGGDHLEVARSLTDLADLYRRRTQPELAEPLFRRAQAIFQCTLGDRHPRMATCLHRLAVMYQQAGQFHDAEVAFGRALEIKEQVLSPGHPSTVSTLSSYAGLLDDLGDYRRAAELRLRIVSRDLEENRSARVDLLDLQLLPPESRYLRQRSATARRR